MEASLILRISCINTDQCKFIKLMLENGGNRPLFEDEVSNCELSWFQALESIVPADNVDMSDQSTLYAVWTLGGADWEEDAYETMSYLKRASVNDVYGVVMGDEGWYELWILRDDNFKRLQKWGGRVLDELFEIDDEVTLVLDNIRSQDMHMR